MLVDTHAHLYWKDYEKDLDEVLKHSIDSGVTTIINVGVDVKFSKIASEQVENKLRKFPGLRSYSTIGIHPHEVLRLVFDPEAQTRRASLAQDKQSNIDVSIHKDITELEKLYQSKPDQPFDPEQSRRTQGRIVAIGECGLDYFFENNPGFNKTSLSIDQQKELQRKLFQAQIDLAKRLNLPLIVHCRDDRSKDPQSSEAWDEVLKMVGNHPAVLHCYSGTIATTRKVLPCPTLFVSFAGNLTYPKNEYLREAVKILPLERILFETDSPFLAPQSKRGQRNEPSSVREIAELVAELKGISFKKAAEQSTVNAKQIFQLR